MNTDVLKNISYGVYVVTTLNEGKTTGCIVNSIMQITSDTIALSVNHKNFTNECIKKSGKIAISILPEDIDDNVIPTFGFQSGSEVDKCQSTKTVDINGIKVIEGAIGYLICELTQTIETSTHSIFLAKIKDGEMLQNKKPMTYAYYHEVKKGKSPKTAPTYIEEKIQEGELQYRCKICGYIYKGDITKEPDTYICPICKKSKEFFEKV